MEYKTFDFHGYQVYTIATEKFKNCYIEVNFRADARRLKLTPRMFLASYLAFVSSKYPTRREMKIQIEELYNASLSTNTLRVGYNIFSEFGLDFVHPKYTQDEKYLEKLIAFLFEILQHPLEINHEYSQDVIDILKENIHRDIDSYKESPASFAMVESKKLLFPKSLSGRRVIGTHEEIEAITKEDLKEEYQNMFQNSYCEILVIGNLDMNYVVSLIEKNFQKSSIVTAQIPFQIHNRFPRYHKVFVDSPYEQSQMILYYEIKELSYFDRFYVLPLFARILGNAGMSDKLTMKLRIGKALCYFTSFQFKYDDFIAYVKVGLSYSNWEIAYRCILEAMREMIHQEIKPHFLEEQKHKFLSDLKLREDSIYGVLDQFYFSSLEKAPMYTDYEKMIPKVTLDDIVRVAKQMKRVFFYLLKEGKKDERN